MTQDDAETVAQVTGLVGLIDVCPAGEDRHFRGRRRPGGQGRVFGGQVISQAIIAASHSVPADRPIHSLHCFFMRPASEDLEIDYAVDADMDGKAFSNRRVVARQNDKPIFNMTASFHMREEGLRHQMPMPDVPPPEELGSFADYVARHPDKASPVFKRLIAKPSPFDYRPVAELTPDALRQPHPGEAFCWIRVGIGPLDLPQPMQRALLAWISDSLLLASAFRAHGIQIGMGGYQSASIDHSMWFHEDVQCGDWLLYAVESPWTGDARGLACGRFFTRDGRLVASCAQEGLMRPVAT
ncbi:MAG: thioesterase family protein [Sphingobium sp.]|nr:thioesterase family protein [Sphingobium sp.]